MEKLLVIGIDGGSFTLLSPLIEQGIMPNLARMMEEGISGELESVCPPVTAPAWSSFITGKNPGQHGIYDFMVKRKDSNEEIPLNSTLREGRAFWDILGEDGNKVLILNIPTTYPPQKVNGVMISDFLTPSGKRDFVYPVNLLDEIENRFGNYPLYFKTPIIVTTPENIEKFLQECRNALHYKFEVARYLRKKEEAPFLLLHIWETDQICHWLWHIFDQTHPEHRKDEAKRFLPEITAYFKALDEEIGKTIHELGEGLNTFVISDHGFGPVYKMVLLNVWLMAEGYLRLKQDPLTRLKYWLWKKGLTPELLFKLYKSMVKRGIRFRSLAPVELLKMLNSGKGRLLSLRDVDWSKTRAYAKMGYGQIFLNLKGREPQGIVEVSESESLRTEIVKKLKDLRDSETGEAIGEGIQVKDELYHGKYFEEAPDITFLPLEKGYLATGGFASNRVITKDWLLKGVHRMKGIFIGKGKAISQAKKITEPRIIDLAPTILYLMGSKIPEDMDGRVLQEALTGDFLKEHPVQFAPVSTEQKIDKREGSEEESAELIERLKGLGYLS
ncbi:MAG: alkaline phosphatase family protein [Proteobacteria bacterium]|nr:alkaline phosphatase family protein [Pseudomonadota bacterium]